MTQAYLTKRKSRGIRRCCSRSTTSLSWCLRLQVAPGPVLRVTYSDAESGTLGRETNSTSHHREHEDPGVVGVVRPYSDTHQQTEPGADERENAHVRHHSLVPPHHGVSGGVGMVHCGSQQQSAHDRHGCGALPDSQSRVDWLLLRRGVEMLAGGIGHHHGAYVRA